MVILATPVLYSSVQDDLIYTIYDPHVTNPTTYPNYKYIGDVYVNSVLVARVKKVPDPVTGIGIFNIAQIVRNYITSSFNPAANTLVSQVLGNGAFNTSVVVKFGEEYSYTAFLNIITDSARIFFNNYNGRLVGILSSLVSKADKIASNSPSIGSVMQGNNYYFVPYFPTTTAAVTVIITPTGGGSAFTTSFTPANAYDLQVLNIAPGALNAISAGAITVATTSYTVQIGSQTYTIKIFCEAVYQSYTLHFLNKYGGFETKLFSKVSRKTIDITRKDFGKLPYMGESIISNNQVYSASVSQSLFNCSFSLYCEE